VKSAANTVVRRVITQASAYAEALSLMTRWVYRCGDVGRKLRL